MTYKYTFSIKQIEKISYYLKQIQKNKITIFEIGSRDAADAFYLSSILKINHRITCFDPHPEFLELSKHFKKMCPNIFMKNIAISDKSRKIPFFLTNTKDLHGKCNDNGIGASSIKIPITNIAGLPTTSYKKIFIDSITGDEFCKKNKSNPDALILDVQGSEIEVLNSFKKKLREIYYLFVEFPVDKGIMYEGDSSGLSIISELKKKGFYLVECYNISQLSADGIFLNINSYHQKKIGFILFIKAKAITQVIKLFLISKIKKTIKLTLNAILQF